MAKFVASKPFGFKKNVSSSGDRKPLISLLLVSLSAPMFLCASNGYATSFAKGACEKALAAKDAKELNEGQRASKADRESELPEVLREFREAEKQFEVTGATESDPEVLLFEYFHKTTPVVGYSGASEDAMRLRLKILDRLRELEATAPSTEIREKAHFIRESWFRQTAKEEQALRTGLFSPTVQKTGKPLRVRSGQRVFALKVTTQPEWERRVQLPPFPFEATIAPSPHWRYGQRTTIKAIEELAASILDRFASLETPGDSPIQVRPLSSTKDHYHSGIYESHTTEGFAPERFATELTNHISVNQRLGDSNTHTYAVTSQREIATYYDTLEGHLQKAGRALRDKEWHPHQEGQGLEINPAHALFLKETSPAIPGSHFTHRTEFQVNLPKEVSGAEGEALRQDAMRALLIEAGVPDGSNMKLVPIVRVETKRMGFDLMWRGEVKIGFVTVDEFRPIPLQPGHPQYGRSILPEAQFEVEILPEWQDLYQSHKKEFGEFFKKLEESVQGKLNPTPKFLHSPKVAPST